MSSDKNSQLREKDEPKTDAAVAEADENKETDNDNNRSTIQMPMNVAAEPEMSSRVTRSAHSARLRGLLSSQMRLMTELLCSEDPTPARSSATSTLSENTKDNADKGTTNLPENVSATDINITLDHDLQYGPEEKVTESETKLQTFSENNTKIEDCQKMAVKEFVKEDSDAVSTLKEIQEWKPIKLLDEEENAGVEEIEMKQDDLKVVTLMQEDDSTYVESGHTRLQEIGFVTASTTNTLDECLIEVLDIVVAKAQKKRTINETDVAEENITSNATYEYPIALNIVDAETAQTNTAKEADANADKISNAAGERSVEGLDNPHVEAKQTSTTLLAWQSHRNQLSWQSIPRAEVHEIQQMSEEGEETEMEEVHEIEQMSKEGDVQKESTENAPKDTETLQDEKTVQVNTESKDGKILQEISYILIDSVIATTSAGADSAGTSENITEAQGAVQGINIGDAGAIRTMFFEKSGNESDDSSSEEGAVGGELVDAGTWDEILSQNNKYSPLHILAGRGEFEKVITIIQSGVDLEERDNEGRTPMHFAAGNVILGLESYLSRMQDIAGARAAAPHGDGGGSLHGHYQTVRLLAESGANVNATDYTGRTPLHLAARMGSPGIVQLLLALGSDVEARDDKGATPLYAAAAGGRTLNVQLLAQAQANVNAATEDGFTPLHISAYFGYPEVVRILLMEGADRNICDNKGYTPHNVSNSMMVDLVLTRRGDDVSEPITSDEFLLYTTKKFGK